MDQVIFNRCFYRPIEEYDQNVHTPEKEIVCSDSLILLST